MVRRRRQRSHEWSNPEYPMVIPNFAIVVDNSCTQAPGWVDPGTGDGNGGQVNHENGKPNGQWGQHGDMRVTSASLGVGSRENGVDKDESADDLRTQSTAFVVASADGVSTAAEGVVGVLHEGLHQPDTADSTQTLRYHVEQGTNERHLAGQEQAKSHRRVDVSTRNAGGAVDEDKDHATEGPCDAEKANAVTWSGLFFVANDGGDGDVEEEECGDKLGDEGSVEGPELDLGKVDERGWRRVYVVLPLQAFLAHFLRHSLS